MRRETVLVLFVIILLMISATVIAQESGTRAPHQDPNLSLEQRVNDLVSRMTLQEKVSQLGHTADAIPRLGVPQYDWWNEGLHGFPQAIGMAATFDDTLMHTIADVISTEFRAKYYARLHPDGSTDWYKGLTVWLPISTFFAILAGSRRSTRWGFQSWRSIAGYLLSIGRPIASVRRLLDGKANVPVFRW
jgi:beta-glucosidase